MDELFFETNIRGGVPIKDQCPIKDQSKIIFSIFFDFFWERGHTFFEGEEGVFLGFRNEIYLFLFDHILYLFQVLGFFFENRCAICCSENSDFFAVPKS